MAGINNTVPNTGTTQGVISPFLNSSGLSTGGTTTPITGGTTGGNFLGQPVGSGVSTPTTSAVNFGGQSSSPSNVGLITLPNGNNGTAQSSSALTSTLPKPGQLTTTQLQQQYPGYSFNAQGQLTNAQGQLYTPPSSGAIQTTPASQNTGGITGLLSTPTNNTQTGGAIAPPPQSGGQTGLVSTTPNPQNGAYTNTGAPGYSPTVGALASTASQPSEGFTTAQNKYIETAQELAKLQSDAAQQNANIGGSRTNLAEAGGEQGLLQNLVAGQESALTGEMSAEQQAAANATSQQGTQQQGLGTAAGLQAPQNANTLGTYNPVTGQYTQYGGGTGGGGAATAGAVGTQVQQGAAVQQMIGQQAQAQALASNLNTVISQAGINPFDVSALTAFANGALKSFMSGSGDAQYQNFNNLINEISSRYASILNQSGGTPTDQSTLSHNIINSLASGQSIQQVLQSLDKNASDSISALKGASGSNTINSNTNASTGNNTTSGYSGWGAQ